MPFVALPEEENVYYVVWVDEQGSNDLSAVSPGPISEGIVYVGECIRQSARRHLAHNQIGQLMLMKNLAALFGESWAANVEEGREVGRSGAPPQLDGPTPDGYYLGPASRRLDKASSRRSRSMPAPHRLARGAHDPPQAFDGPASRTQSYVILIENCKNQPEQFLRPVRRAICAPAASQSRDRMILVMYAPSLACNARY